MTFNPIIVYNIVQKDRGMIRRWQESIVRDEMASRRCVHLTGVRQCGKTTLAEYISGNSMRHLTLDDEQFRLAAKDDPSSFVNRIDGRPLVIDEIQKVPELLNAIKIRIDHDSSPGQYLITGSSNLLFQKSVSDSLAGRLGRIRLRTMALGEIQGGRGDFLTRAFTHEFGHSFQKFDKRDVIHAAFCGGYPEPLGFNVRARRRWYGDYLHDLIAKDIREIAEVRKIDALGRVMDWMMAYSSKFFELKDLCAAAHIGIETLENYIAALKALYLVDEVAPWAGSDYAKLGKRPKFFASDSGLIANSLGWDEESVYFDDDKCGKLVETWVYHELSVLADNDYGYEITQFRDGARHEIDFIIRNVSGAMLGVEVKAGAVSDDDFKHLKWFAANRAKGDFIGIVLYSGKEVLGFGQNLYAVPHAALAC